MCSHSNVKSFDQPGKSRLRAISESGDQKGTQGRATKRGRRAGSASLTLRSRRRGTAPTASSALTMTMRNAEQKRNGGLLNRRSSRRRGHSRDDGAFDANFGRQGKGDGADRKSTRLN